MFKTLKNAMALERNHLKLNTTACNLCGRCAKACSRNAIYIDRASGEWVLAKDKCTLCKRCIRVCRRGALSIRKS